LSEEQNPDPKPYSKKLVEDARRFLSYPYLAEDPKRLTMGIAVEDPDNPDEGTLETARRTEALGAKV
jgi:hypothetical protein